MGFLFQDMCGMLRSFLLDVGVNQRPINGNTQVGFPRVGQNRIENLDSLAWFSIVQIEDLIPR